MNEEELLASLKETPLKNLPSMINFGSGKKFYALAEKISTYDKGTVLEIEFSSSAEALTTLRKVKYYFMQYFGTKLNLTLLTRQKGNKVYFIVGEIRKYRQKLTEEV